VEAVALRVPRERQLTLGAWAGLLVGTIGVAAEWAWSHVWVPIPWPASLLPEAAVLGLVAGVSGGVLGGLVARALAPAPSRQPVPRWTGALAGLGALLCLAYPLPMSGPNGVRATVELRDLSPAPERTVEATITVEPAAAADGAEWFTVTAWQGAGDGDGGLVIDGLRRTGPRTWETTEPIPVSGEWKANLRLQSGRTLAALPIYLPEDRAIPAEEVPAEARFTRAFVTDKELLQREQTGGEPWLEWTAYLTIVGIFALWVASIAWGLGRLSGREPGRRLPRPAVAG